MSHLFANFHATYIIATSKCTSRSSLIDRGVRGGICGADYRVIESATTQRTDNIQGIDNQTIPNVHIVSSGGVVITQHGLVIIIIHQYVYFGKGTSIHSTGQLEYFGNNANAKSVKVPGGTQHILTLDGYVLLLDVSNGLPYLRMQPYTDK